MQVSLRTCCLIIAATICMNPSIVFAGSLDHLTDLTGKMQVNVTLKGRDNFTSEYRYDVSVRNLSPDTIILDSLIIVLDKITNLAGKDHEGLTEESFLKRFDILDLDGHTEDGKPFFHIPTGTSRDLVSQTDSLPVSIRIRNRDYVAVFTPSFKVLGQKRPPPEEKRADSPAPLPPPAQKSPPPADRKTMEKLIQLLIKKGVLTEEEWRKANRP